MDKAMDDQRVRMANSTAKVLGENVQREIERNTTEDERLLIAEMVKDGPLRFEIRIPELFHSIIR